MSQHNGLPVVSACDGLPGLHESTISLLPPLDPLASSNAASATAADDAGASGAQDASHGLVATTQMFAQPIFRSDGTRPVLTSIVQSESILYQNHVLKFS